MADSYKNDGQQRLVAVVEALAENLIEGRTASEVGEAIETSAVQAFRTLKNLEIAGWAEQLSTGYWRLSPTVTRISDRVRQTLADYHHRYLPESTGP